MANSTVIYFPDLFLENKCDQVVKSALKDKQCFTLHADFMQSIQRMFNETPPFSIFLRICGGVLRDRFSH